MKVLLKIFIFSLFSFAFVLSGLSQQNDNILENRMRQYENNIFRSYLEYQKLYYEDKASLLELKAFEDLLSVYINQVMEIYETLNLSEEKIHLPREIAARALIFKALMYLEKAPLNVEYYEKACYEYYEALKLYEGTEDPPVMFKDLPQEIQAGEKVYYRLIDLLDDKGKGLLSFGKVEISFKNFRVTANFNPQMIELIKVPDESNSNNRYTYKLAESRIIKAFEEVFQKNREIITYVALPYGTYILQLNPGDEYNYTALTRFYVRDNQEHQHVIEPLANWVILYENPTCKRPDFYKFRRNNQNLSTTDLASNNGKQTNGANTSKSRNAEQSDNQEALSVHEQLVSEIVAELLPKFEINMMFDLNDPEIKAKAIQIISRTIVNYVKSRAFYNEWNLWTVSWDISKKVREVISPGSLVPIELIELIYKSIKEL